jgi:ribulose-5-phosphate 4-epimerase/fuculose-1-phosphate aldolase
VSVLDETLDELVTANRILADHDVLDAFGHVSVRHPDRHDRYLLSCSRSPRLVGRTDVLEFTLEGEPIDARERRLYAERPIHGRIYAARSEVNAVCYNHSPATIPFGTTGIPLRPIFHMGSVIGSRVPVWDIADEFGDTNLLVTTNAMGDSLGVCLGFEPVVLMRGHGCAVVGETLRMVVFRSIYMQKNAELLSAALALGGNIRYLNDGETRRAAATLSEPLSQERAWESWVSRL